MSELRICGRSMSIEDISEYVLKVINLNNKRRIIERDEDLFLRDLIKYHYAYERKRGCGIEYFYVGENVKYGCNSLYVKRIDGTYTDFSYMKCIMRKSDINHMSFEMVLYDEINKYREDNINEEGYFVSVYSGEMFYVSELCVIYDGVLLSGLIDKFISENNIEINKELIIISEDNNEGTKFIDVEMEKSFKEYYKKANKKNICEYEYDKYVESMENRNEYMEKHLNKILSYDVRKNNSKITMKNHKSHYMNMMKFMNENKGMIDMNDMYNIGVLINEDNELNMDKKKKYIYIAYVLEEDEKKKNLLYDLYICNSGTAKVEEDKRMNNIEHINWIDIVKDIGKSEDILIQLYTRIPVLRDDYKKIMIDEKNNKFILEEYKTAKVYGVIEFDIPEFFKDKLGEIKGLKKYKGKLNEVFQRRVGYKYNITQLRHSFCTFLRYNGRIFSEEERNMCLRIMGHSDLMSLKYIGNKSASVYDINKFIDSDENTKWKNELGEDMSLIDKISIKMSVF